MFRKKIEKAGAVCDSDNNRELSWRSAAVASQNHRSLISYLFWCATVRRCLVRSLSVCCGVEDVSESC